MIFTKLRVLLSFLCRNIYIYIYNDPKRKVQKKHVNLHYWKISPNQQNIGDYLSVVIVEYMLKMRNINPQKKIHSTKHLYAIGSIIDGGYHNAVVWGSGVHRGKRRLWWKHIRKLDIRAVRGPLTRETMIENGYSCPSVYGDPAILLPLFYTPHNTEKKYDYLVIHHHSEKQSIENGLSPITNDWMGFVDKVVQSKLVVSSSLHGIILAEAYGIPAVLLSSGENTFKYSDYYYSTERYSFPVADTLESALKLTPAPLPDFIKMREALISAFPYDIWE